MTNLYKSKLNHSAEKSEIMKTLEPLETQKIPKSQKAINLVIGLNHLENATQYRDEIAIYAKRKGLTIKEYVLGLIDKDMNKGELEEI